MKKIIPYLFAFHQQNDMNGVKLFFYFPENIFMILKRVKCFISINVANKLNAVLYVYTVKNRYLMVYKVYPSMRYRATNQTSIFCYFPSIIYLQLVHSTKNKSLSLK
jgi:hypothetical protein